jgi:type II secretory ATPase GspE/PulE/Tfp pilus assembly ATPase PilB-like protein
VEETDNTYDETYSEANFSTGTLIMEPGERPGPDGGAWSAAVGSPSQYIDLVEQRLASYLGGNEALTDFQPMMEWDLSTRGRLSEADILQAYGYATKIPILDDEVLDDIERFPNVTFDYLSERLCLPISWDADFVLIAVAIPYKIGEIAYHWKHILGRDATFVLVQRSHIERVAESVYNSQDELAARFLDPNASDEEQLVAAAAEAPIVRLVNDIFARAIETGTSDIHVEPMEKELSIRFRIDGVLHVEMNPPVASYSAIASRLKLIAGLNIAERRLPQDGRTEVQIGRAAVDIRMSTLPAIHGESIVLRLLRKDVATFSLDNIGMGSELQDRFRGLIKMPFGMVLVVGPTGSGKTTTLYCAMNILNSEEKKIITVEEPVEYQIGGVTQMQVRPSIGLTFANGLRSIVRQDPDIILVGEIRDRETAEIAINAALTGHLVLSTLHTNDATGAISRLIDMGVEPFLIASALVGVLSQRLVRRICPTCEGTGKVVENGNNRNCRTCTGKGLSGRVGIFEFLVMDDEIRNAATSNADNSTLNSIARKNGMTTLREDGVAKAKAGLTSEAEIAAACQLDAL